MEANFCLLFSGRQIAQPSSEKSPLRLLLRQANRSLVRGARFRPASKPPAQLRPRGVRQVILGEIAAPKDRVDQRKPRRRTILHRYGHGSVQLNHRGRSHPH